MKKCVLAYSGGLDTSAIVPWLVEQGYEVHAVLVDVGQNEDLHALCDKALEVGATTAIVRDAVPAMFKKAIPLTIGLQATYEGTYRLGTALARPFIALEQIRRARELGGATLVHGATGKGNDQIRFEFAYRTLAPECPVLAPWKVWSFEGREDLVNYLKAKNIPGDYEVTKVFSMDENLWHLSVEGGDLEDASASLDVEAILANVSDRFAGGATGGKGPDQVTIQFENGVPTTINGKPYPLVELVAELNGLYRSAPWAWDVVIENRFTGIKSRGIYLNPAAKLLHWAVDGLARTCLNKTVYDRYTELGREFGALMYRGEFFSQQCDVVAGAAEQILKYLNGAVTVSLKPTPHVSKIDAPEAIFTKSVATFEKSDYKHSDADGFIHLTWLSCIGAAWDNEAYEDLVETTGDTASDVCAVQSKPGGRLVPATA